MHVANTPGEPLTVIQPIADRPANRLEGEVFDIWIHPDYEGRGMEKELIRDL